MRKFTVGEVQFRCDELDYREMYVSRGGIRREAFGSACTDGVMPSGCLVGKLSASSRIRMIPVGLLRRAGEMDFPLSVMAREEAG